jgi:hypothetical protein
MRHKRNTYRVLVGTPEGRRALGRPRHKWKLALKQAMKVLIWGEKYSSTLSLTVLLDGGVGGQQHALATPPSAKNPSTHCAGGWVGPRAILDRS